MAYYRGDYYRGDYYRGDFLGIGKGLKKLAGAAVGAVKGFISGGPVGAVSGGLGALTKSTAQVQGIAQQGIVGTAIKVGSKVLPPLLAGKEIYDLASPLFGRNGHKRRTMNHLNPRALARSTRRIEGFIKKARKIASPLGYTLQRRGAGGTRAKRRCR